MDGPALLGVAAIITALGTLLQSIRNGKRTNQRAAEIKKQATDIHQQTTHIGHEVNSRMAELIAKEAQTRLEVNLLQRENMRLKEELLRTKKRIDDHK